MYRRSYMTALAMAAAISASNGAAIGQMFRAPAPAAPRVKKHDPERMAAAIAKRERKNAKRLRDMRPLG